MFSILDQKQAKAVRILEERSVFLSNANFINASKYNTIKEVDFRRRNVKIATEIYNYSKGEADDKVKHPQKGIKMDRTTTDIAGLVAPKFMEYYSYIYLDLDVLFLNGVAFLLTKSRKMGFIHYKVILTKLDKQVINGPNFFGPPLISSAVFMLYPYFAMIFGIEEDSIFFTCLSVKKVYPSVYSTFGWNTP